MATHDTMVVGASAGGVQALSSLVSGISRGLPAAVFIVLHIPADSPSLLPEILARDSQLLVKHAKDGEEILRGRIYVAPPDQHLLIERQRVRLVHGPKENLHRPSIDALFRSAARWSGPRTIGVVLTGACDDGAAGMLAIKQRGGLTIIQDPEEARFPAMPLSVLQGMKVDYSLSVREIAPLLDKLSRQATKEEGRYPVSEDVEIETRIAQQEMEAAELIAGVERLGQISRLTCPEVEAGSPDLAMITAIDTTEAVQVKKRLEAVQREQAELVGELSAANKRFADMNKELQDANEELQAANEELMLTQEELQATNEELQTTNEELQTTNDELTARTMELHHLTRETTEEQFHLSELLERFPYYVMLVNAEDLTIQAVNPGYALLLGKRKVVGQSLTEFFSGSDLDQLVETLREVTEKGKPLTTPPMAVKAAEYGGLPEDLYVHSIVPLHQPDGHPSERLFIYTEKA